MARSVNKLILVGNVGRDPEVNTTMNGDKVAHFSLATSRRIPKSRGFEERTEWHRITAWDRLAELCEEYVRKGDRLYIEGSMQYDSYERNGQTIPTAEVVVRELVMLGSARTFAPPAFKPDDDDDSFEEDEPEVKVDRTDNPLYQPDDELGF